MKLPISLAFVKSLMHIMKSRGQRIGYRKTRFKMSKYPITQVGPAFYEHVMTRRSTSIECCLLGNWLVMITFTSMCRFPRNASSTGQPRKRQSSSTAHSELNS